MTNTGAIVWARAMMYKAVLHPLQLNIRKIWVVMEETMKVLEGLHYQVDRRISEMKAWRVEEERWEWPLVAEVLEAAGMWPMKECIRRRKDTIAEYIENLLIYELCTGAERMPVSSRFMRWWDQYLKQEEEGNGASKGVDREVG